MSVLKTERSLSKYEYVYSFIRLYNYTEDRLARIPKRKAKYLATPISEIMNDIFDDITQINNQYFQYGIKLKTKQEQAQQVIDKLVSLQMPLLTLWNIEGYKENTMITWVRMIEEEISYLSNMGGLSVDNSNRMFILDHKAISEMDFLNNMAEIQKFIYSKVISLPESCTRTNGMLLVHLVDKAFYHLAEANRFVPRNKCMYENRKKHIEIAFDRINKMQIPTISIFLQMKYSEKIMKEWSGLINREMKLLNGLKKSDAKRFGDLT